MNMKFIGLTNSFFVSFGFLCTNTVLYADNSQDSNLEYNLVSSREVLQLDIPYLSLIEYHYIESNKNILLIKLRNSELYGIRMDSMQGNILQIALSCDESWLDKNMALVVFNMGDQSCKTKVGMVIYYNVIDTKNPLKCIFSFPLSGSVCYPELDKYVFFDIEGDNKAMAVEFHYHTKNIKRIGENICIEGVFETRFKNINPKYHKKILNDNGLISTMENYKIIVKPDSSVEFKGSEGVYGELMMQLMVYEMYVIHKMS